MDMCQIDPMWDQKRHIIMDEIHDISMEAALRFFYYWDDQVMAPDDSLQLIVNSGGGSLHSALALIDQMESCRHPVATYATGMVASSGLLIAMTGAAGKRTIHKNTNVLSHQFSSGSSGTFSDLEADSVLFEHINEAMIKHYMKHTKKTRKYVKTNLLKPNNVWLTADEAVKHGLFDKVVG